MLLRLVFCLVLAWGFANEKCGQILFSYYCSDLRRAYSGVGLRYGDVMVIYMRLSKPYMLVVIFFLVVFIGALPIFRDTVDSFADLVRESVCVTAIFALFFGISEYYKG